MASATGAGTAVFPHTLVVAEENCQATVVDSFVSADETAHFALGANDLYAGQIDFLTADIPWAVEFAKAGKIRILATASDTRSSARNTRRGASSATRCAPRRRASRSSFAVRVRDKYLLEQSEQEENDRT
mgnify:CR=1 FL=1